jgi:hypothetical protein
VSLQGGQEVVVGLFVQGAAHKPVHELQPGGTLDCQVGVVRRLSLRGGWLFLKEIGNYLRGQGERVKSPLINSERSAIFSRERLFFLLMMSGRLDESLPHKVFLEVLRVINWGVEELFEDFPCSFLIIWWWVFVIDQVRRGGRNFLTLLKIILPIFTYKAHLSRTSWYPTATSWVAFIGLGWRILLGHWHSFEMVLLEDLDHSLRNLLVSLSLLLIWVPLDHIGDVSH